MSYFATIGFLDIFDVIARLNRLKNDFVDDVLSLRTIDGKEIPSFQEWKSLQRLLKQVRAASRLTEEWGEILVDRLQPGSVTEWSKELSVEYHTLFVPLITNPGAREYAQEEAIVPLPGVLYAVSQDVYRSSANWGGFPRYHLIVQVRKASD